MRRIVVWLFAAISGALTGAVAFTFLKGLDWATRTRIAHGGLILLLPVAGFLVAASYHYWGGRAKGGTPAVVEQAHTFTHGVPARMTPLIWAGSVVGHLFGASVGREGAALQLAGSVSDTASRVGRLHSDERRTLIAAALAGGWGAVFAVPFTGVAFALQMAKTHRRRVLVPAAISAFTGKWVVDAMGYRFGDRPSLPRAEWTVALPFKLALFGLAIGLVGRLFVSAVKTTKRKMAHAVHYPPVRAAIGGAATLLAVAAFGRDYLGLSTPLYSLGIAGGHVDWWVPFLKLLFTAIALGTGYVGGEVLPLFVMGSTLGGTAGPMLNASGPLLAATGAPAAFAGAATVMLTGVTLTVEQFGWWTLVPALIVGLFAKMSAGRPGLYLAH